MPLSAKPLQPESFLDPLHIILTEHDRQRRVAEWLWTHSGDQRLAPIQEQVVTLLAYLTRDLLLHHRDEEDDLFPVLRARCEAIRTRVCRWLSTRLPTGFWHSRWLTWLQLLSDHHRTTYGVALSSA